MIDFRDEYQPSTRELAEFDAWLERNPDFAALRRGPMREQLQRNTREDRDGRD